MNDDAEPRPNRAPRRDAQLRRDALIDAAATCFAERGYGVPLETIAAAAGVGRATLYRNFEDREALALAIFSQRLDRLAAAVDPILPIRTTIEQMVRAAAEPLALFARIAAELHLNDAKLPAFQSLRDRLETIVAPILTAAQARGEVRDDASPRDLMLTIRMVGCLVQPHMGRDEVDAQINAGLALVLAGLRPR